MLLKRNTCVLMRSVNNLVPSTPFTPKHTHHYQISIYRHITSRNQGNIKSRRENKRVSTFKVNRCFMKWNKEKRELWLHNPPVYNSCHRCHLINHISSPSKTSFPPSTSRKERRCPKTTGVFQHKEISPMRFKSLVTVSAQRKNEHLHNPAPQIPGVTLDRHYWDT